MAPLSRSTTTGQLKGTLFSAREPTTAGEREVQLFGRSDPPPSPVLGALSGGYIAEAIDAFPLSLLLAPATPSWPPPGARDNSPRVSEFTVSTSHPTSPASAAGNTLDFYGPPPNLHLEVLPQEVVSRICAISVTNDCSTRPTLQATSKFLFNTVCSTPDAWDTFEVMTGTPGSLNAPPQVEECIQRSGARPLSVALTVARSQDQHQPENVQAIIEKVVEAASRIEDLILDVHCDASEHALVGLFNPSHLHQSILRRLALVGNLQLDYILSSLQHAPPSPMGITQDTPLTQPLFSSLRHLTIAYCPIYSLNTTINTVESLKLGVTFLAPQSPGGSLVGLLRAFPSLCKLELQTLTYAPGYNPRICERDSSGKSAVLQLDDLEELVLDSIPLDCEVFASLRCAHVRKLALKEVLPESTDEGLAVSGSASDWDTTDRFEEFVARQDWGHLEVLEVNRVYEGVSKTCVELIKIAEGRLKELTLGGFAWDACKALMTPCHLPTPNAVEPQTRPTAAILDIPNHFPALEKLVIRLDDTEDHHQLARQAWMEGLQQFSLGRIVYDTVADVLFRGYQNAPKWLQALGQEAPGWQLAHEGTQKHHPGDFEHYPPMKAEASTRTLTHISLETSFNDSYAFIWNEYEYLKDIYGPPV